MHVIQSLIVNLLLFSLTFQALAYKPHILFVVLDDLGSHDLGLHGTGIHTPHIDLLARNGVYMNNYYVLPSCSPTRSAIMTGRYPLHTGIHNWIDYPSTIGLPQDEETLPQLLRRGGYTAHAVGKWHLGHSQYNQTPTFRGFESFYGFYIGGEDYFNHTDDRGGYDMRWDQRENCGRNCSVLRDERGNYSTHVFTREAIQVIHNYATIKHEKPLFLYLAHQAVHAPDEVPPMYRKSYENRSDWSELRKTYAGMLSVADESIFNVTQALKKYGLWNETLIVFTTDNGGPTDTCAIQGSSNYPKRGGKCSAWEGGTTGDGFISGPVIGKLGINGSTVLNSLFHCVDWLPTLACIVGITPAGKPLDGVNQLASLKDPTTESRQELFIGYGISIDEKWTGPAIRWQDYKLIESGWRWGPHNIPNVTPTYELYNLSDDPSETNDIAPENPVLVQLIRHKLIEYTDQLAPIPSSNPECPWHLTNTSMFGPTWFPWCEGATQFVLYN